MVWLVNSVCASATSPPSCWRHTRLAENYARPDGTPTCGKRRRARPRTASPCGDHGAYRSTPECTALCLSARHPGRAAARALIHAGLSSSPNAGHRESRDDSAFPCRPFRAHSIGLLETLATCERPEGRFVYLRARLVRARMPAAAFPALVSLRPGSACGRGHSARAGRVSPVAASAECGRGGSRRCGLRGTAARRSRCLCSPA
jgi:hypothetical protein